ncbi:MAG TPA: PhzF family phenazine biosynthesis protein, partial [Pyrinomonadaceae bacterium]|nr:PhzF family phenazine biosynthesis protein [Pyrinomonadaceae bacterium]
MRKYEFYQLDVFTDTAFAGNALAVFPSGEGLTQEEMQKIAREMNLSETVFVLPSERALRRLRIFTPMQELPLAGHPVVGTWYLLATLGVVPHQSHGTVTIDQELNLGILPVDIEFRDEKPFQVTMTQGKFEAGAIVSNERDISSLAQGLGLDAADLSFSRDLPVQVVSTGIRALDIPVASLEALARCRINSSLLSEIYLSYGAIGCYAFTLLSEPSAVADGLNAEKTNREDTAENSTDFPARVHARFFAPDDNIPED